MYLIKIDRVFFAYSTTAGERSLSKDQAAALWAAAYPEHAGTIEVIDAPAADAAGNPFSVTWGRSYLRTDHGFSVHAKGG